MDVCYTVLATERLSLPMRYCWGRRLSRMSFRDESLLDGDHKNKLDDKAREERTGQFVLESPVGRSGEGYSLMAVGSL